MFDHRHRRPVPAAAREWFAALANERDVSDRLGKLANIVTRDHPAGHDAIQARFRIERAAAGNDAAQLEAMLERWAVLAEEAADEVERKRQARFDENLRHQMETMRRAAVDAWRANLPLHEILRSLRVEVDDVGQLRGVNDDGDLLTAFDRVSAALKAADQAIGAARREAKVRISTARAAATVETFAPSKADATAAA